MIAINGLIIFSSSSKSQLAVFEESTMKNLSFLIFESHGFIKIVFDKTCFSVAVFTNVLFMMQNSFSKILFYKIIRLIAVMSN